MPERYRDRAAAGGILAAELHDLDLAADALVLGLPRGGVPVAAEVAARLDAPLDVLLVRKLGVPGHEELAFGAIASGGAKVLNQEIVAQLRLPSARIADIVERETRELERRALRYRGTCPSPPRAGRSIILVDDGLATGATMRAAVAALRTAAPAEIIIAVPVAPPETAALLAHEADRLVCPWQPQSFRAVGQFYDDFAQTTDDEVAALIAQAAQRTHAPAVGHREDRR